MSHDVGKASNLVRVIIDHGDITRAAALSDALEAAGCRHPTILQGLRSGIAARMCWISELLGGTEIGSVVRTHFGTTRFVHRPETRLILLVPEPIERHRAGLPKLCAGIAERLNVTLKSADVGRAKEGYGTGGYEDDILVEITGLVDIVLLGEVELGLAMLRKVLSQLDVPRESTLSIWERDEWQTIPLQ